jgi:hypothetical protein
MIIVDAESKEADAMHAGINATVSKKEFFK